METRTSASVEQAAEHKQHRIDGAPRDVAPDRCYDQSMQIELAAFRKQAPPGGDGERHDEPEQQLRQAFVGSEIAMDQRQA